MPRYPRYTTFRPEELQEQMKALDPEGTRFLSPQQVFPGTVRIKCHTFSVTFPDGQEGTCHYDRRAPQWHIYRYQYSDGVWMPYQSWNQTLLNETGSIEAKGRELTAACYREAIQRERRDYFQRATEPSDGSRKKCPQKYRMKPAEAKAQAGKYALCERLGESLYPVSPLFDTIEGANALWREKGDPNLVVACCNRLDRCYSLLRYNPLYAEHDPRPALQTASDTSPEEEE